MLRAFADMRRVGLPDDLILQIARLYASMFDELQRRLVTMFAGWAPDTSGIHDPLMNKVSSTDAARIVRDVRVVANYTQHRNLQRQVMVLLERLASSSPPAAAGESA